MEYSLSIGSLIIGFLILVAGVVFVRFHQWVADNFGAGVSSYERYKLYAFITCGVGLLVMLNLHTLFFGWVAGLIFNR